MRPFVSAVCSSSFLLMGSLALGQVGGGATGGVGNLGTAANQNQRTIGLQQTGQLSSDAAIQRQEGTFVGSGSGSFLSSSGTTGALNTGGQAGGLNSLTSLGGLSALGGGIGGGRGFGGTGFGGQGGFGNQQFQTQAGGAGTATQLRIPIRIGFTPRTIITPAAVSAGFQARLTRLPGLGSVAGGVVVRMDGRTAVLEGVVSDPGQRDLIARLALLEPGISAVRNDLRVEPPRPTPALPQP